MIRLYLVKELSTFGSWSRCSSQVLLGSYTKEPFDMPVERFLESIRFENKAKLDGLGLEIDPNTIKIGD